MSNLWVGHTFEILLKLEWDRVLKIKLAAVTYSGNDDLDDDHDDYEDGLDDKDIDVNEFPWVFTVGIR